MIQNKMATEKLGFEICALTTIPERADVGDGSVGWFKIATFSKSRGYRTFSRALDGKNTFAKFFFEIELRFLFAQGPQSFTDFVTGDSPILLKIIVLEAVLTIRETSYWAEIPTKLYMCVIISVTGL